MFSAPSTALRRPRVTRLILADFRSYDRLDIALDAAVVVLTGENGAGKTNVIEALSLLSPGRGLRRAALADCARSSGCGRFAVSVEVAAEDASTTLGTGLEPQSEGQPARRWRVNRAPATPRDLADHLRLVWQTPDMDGLFRGPAGDRRRFLDRLVLAVDSGHAARVSALERAGRNRNRLLADGVGGSWLDAAEREYAELAVAVAAARRETVMRLTALLADRRDDAGAFPWCRLALDGEVEGALDETPALRVEERYRATLRDNRHRDAAAGRTVAGPQATDLVVRHGPKDIAARQASTGEQKALLTGLVLGHARLVAGLTGIAPLMLLDEISAHFDPVRRAALFAETAALGGQVWMTGADDAAFADIGADAARLHVTPGAIAVL